ncbi:MAG TPA: hypothetical protein VM536_05825, partial [Chloroflexia bacterium]|nr:hypothetical protein [Chloroflexia bacterium]
MPDQGDAPAAVPRRSLLRGLRDALLVTLITLGLTLSLLEVALRLFAPQIPVGIANNLYTPDPAAHYRLAPGAAVRFDSAEIHTDYRVNSQGVREDHDFGPPAPDHVRMLVLGDSMTFGVGVDANQTFTHLLDGSPVAGGGTLETVNAGVSGYGPDNEVAWLHAHGWAFQPKILLVAFFVGNDVRDVMLGTDKTEVAGDGSVVVNEQVLRARDRLRARSEAEVWLSYNSHAYIFLRRQWDALLPAQRPPDLFDGPYIFLTPEPPALAAGWDQTLPLLDELRWKAEQHGAAFVVVVLPAREQVVDRYWEENRHALSLLPEQLDREAPQRR